MKKIVLGFVALLISLPVWSADVFTVSGDDDSDLNLGNVKLTLELKDGVTKKTKNKRFTKVRVSRPSRRGEKSFEAWCSLSGEVSLDKQESSVGCGLYEDTVSNDDDESLGFSVLQRRNVGVREPEFVFTGLSYMGDGTIFDDELKVLFGNNYDLEQIRYADSTDVALEGTLENTPEQSPFVLLALVGDSLKGLLGRLVYSDDLEATVKVKAVEFSVSEKMNLGLTLRVGRDADHGVSVGSRPSLLKDPKDLSKGLTSSETILERAIKTLPKQ